MFFLLTFPFLSGNVGGGGRGAGLLVLMMLWCWPMKGERGCSCNFNVVPRRGSVVQPSFIRERKRVAGW